MAGVSIAADISALAAPSAWVQRFAPLIPATGPVLDVACGRGRHMCYLAGQGLEVWGVDRDWVAVQQARQWGAVVQADLEQGQWPFQAQSVSALLVCNYLWRTLFSHLFRTVQTGGLLLYETFADGQQHIGRPQRPEFLLQRGELLQQVAQAGAHWHVLAYEDIHDLQQGRYVQRIVARRTQPE